MRWCNWFVLLTALLCAQSSDAQRARGELRVEVRDPQGTALPATAELVSSGNQFRRNFQIAQDGRYVAQELPFGVYSLSLKADGFAPWAHVVEIRSELPIRLVITLGIAPGDNPGSSKRFLNLSRSQQHRYSICNRTSGSGREHCSTAGTGYLQRYR